ncbi:MAG: carboxymuconolactone decarboxylase family protein [Pseudooceanicola sp.]
MNATDLPPIGDMDWPEGLGDLLEGFAGKLNVYRVMAYHPHLLRAWEALRGHVVTDTALGAVFSEVVILRTGVHLGSHYEWAHHVSRARALGMTDARIASIRGDLSGMAPDDAVLAGAVDALFADKALSPEQAEAVTALVGRAGMFDLIATVGFYSTLGFILNTFDVPLDDRIAAELSEKPLEG